MMLRQNSHISTTNYIVFAQYIFTEIYKVIMVRSLNACNFFCLFDIKKLFIVARHEQTPVFVVRYG